MKELVEPQPLQGRELLRSVTQFLPEFQGAAMVCLHVGLSSTRGEKGRPHRAKQIQLIPTAFRAFRQGQPSMRGRVLRSLRAIGPAAKAAIPALVEVVTDALLV